MIPILPRGADPCLETARRSPVELAVTGKKPGGGISPAMMCCLRVMLAAIRPMRSRIPARHAYLSTWAAKQLGLIMGPSAICTGLDADRASLHRLQSNRDARDVRPVDCDVGGGFRFPAGYRTDSACVGPVEHPRRLRWGAARPSRGAAVVVM
ncbi:hypothetical protein DL766_000582 [Monosporascus sp. MC13-8B]|uniref:Uncharacterized protein n=1 Tax=Monosporascus cannonballus TaxID=155416 RepID=A0ABY0GT82_9PEZI|nr:hypothetical protein DL762_010372 [Monosporascus cannonballus]RYO86977.1 hypothetical protein DL763_006524 [Monosporascus cannonballus]RYP39126.1 hypothetical protein DL766_000582 [Monosporascus sp. MC13-8B]